jgi:hypothetical protein
MCCIFIVILSIIYAKFFIVLLSVVILSVVVLSIILLSVSCANFCLFIVMLTVLMSMLSVVILSVAAPFEDFFRSTFWQRRVSTISKLPFMIENTC